MTSRTIFALALAGLLVLAPRAAFACYWDFDTLLQERARFPSTLEIITGKFLVAVNSMRAPKPYAAALNVGGGPHGVR